MLSRFAKLSYEDVLSLAQTTTPAKIAAEYGVSPNAVDHKIRRARERCGLPLRSSLQHLRPGEPVPVKKAYVQPKRVPLTAFHALDAEELIELTNVKSYRDITVQFGVTLDQVRNRIYRARDKLGLTVAPIPRTEVERPKSPITEEDDRRWLAAIHRREARQLDLIRRGKAATYVPAASSAHF